MDIAYIHIGMIKTATTYMQNIWLNDKAFSLSWQGNIKYLQSLRDMVAKDNIAQEVPLDIQPDRPVHQGQKLVISNEGFSSALSLIDPNIKVKFRLLLSLLVAILENYPIKPLICS